MSKSIKLCAQTVLKRVGLYDRSKSSCLYGLYWRMADPQIIKDRSSEIDFYRRTLEGFERGNLVFDIGANQGYKTDIFLRIGARVVAVDPDTVNQESLRAKFLRYRFMPKPVTLVGKAVSERCTVATMWVDAPGSAKNTLSNKWVETLKQDDTRFGHHLEFAGEMEVETTTLDELMVAHGVPFFIKIDVEGHERSVLQGLKRPVPYLSFEVNLPEFRSEGLQCVELLAQVCAQGEFNYATDCQSGLALKPWLPHREFAHVFNELADASLEVFWRTPFKAA
jgi:FkbM family methyltransferase